MKQKVVLFVPYAVLCALNDWRLGICRQCYIEWALSSGFAKSTASKYWSIAKQMFYEEKRGEKELIVYPTFK